MDVFVDPKTVFKSDSWAKRAYYSVRSWFKYTFNKYHIKLVKEALNGRPWDYSYLLRLERAKIEEMMDYHERRNFFVGWEIVVRNMKICLSLIEIILGERKLFHFDGQLLFVDTTEEEKERMGGRAKKIGQSEDFKYNCDVYVNVRNIDRFVPKNAQKWYIRHPDELYVLKAKYLYHKIRVERDEEWWD